LQQPTHSLRANNWCSLIVAFFEILLRDESNQEITEKVIYIKRNVKLRPRLFLWIRGSA
jgi:hypothetical protein